MVLKSACAGIPLVVTKIVPLNIDIDLKKESGTAECVLFQKIGILIGLFATCKLSIS